MKIYATRSKEIPPAAHKAQQPSKSPQAGATVPSPVTWQAGSVRLPSVFGSRAGVLPVVALPFSSRTAQTQSTQETDRKPGLPSDLKSRFEALSDISLDDVQVHYNSSRPAALGALAYAQGLDIYIGPGQERHLPHEAWHVVQQKQGRVAQEYEIDGIAINSDTELEKEACSANGGSSLLARRPKTNEGKTENNIAQLVIISPPSKKLDTVIAIAIYQQLRNKIDDHVATFELLGRGSIDLKNEKTIHIQGHGSEEGLYEGISGETIGKLLQKYGAPDELAVCLDYCYSAKAAESVKKQLSPLARIEANINRAVTQGTGEVKSKTNKPEPHENEKFANIVTEIKQSKEWTSAQDLTEKLKKELVDAEDKGEGIEIITHLFLKYGELIWADIGAMYEKLYAVNEKLVASEYKYII